MQDVALTPETRARAVRARLPGQMLHQRIENSQLTYGPLYTLAEIRQRVGEALPRRFGYVRSAVLEPIESYRDLIPDHALLKYDDAVQSGLFDKFWVATPTAGPLSPAGTERARRVARSVAVGCGAGGGHGLPRLPAPHVRAPGARGGARHHQPSRGAERDQRSSALGADEGLAHARRRRQRTRRRRHRRRPRVLRRRRSRHGRCELARPATA